MKAWLIASGVVLAPPAWANLMKDFYEGGTQITVHNSSLAEKRTRHVRKVEQLNDEYLLYFRPSGQKDHTFVAINKQEADRLHQKYSQDRRRRWRTQRTTGGDGAGSYIGLTAHINTERTLLKITPTMQILDYDRQGDSRSPLILDRNGAVAYNNRWVKYPDYDLEEFSFRVPPQNEPQSFVLDFGKRKVVPIHVLGYMDRWAIFTTLEGAETIRQADENSPEAKEDPAGLGLEIGIDVFSAHPEILRIASPTEYQLAVLRYLNERAQQDGSIEGIIVANRSNELLAGHQPMHISLRQGKWDKETQLDLLKTFRSMKAPGGGGVNLCNFDQEFDQDYQPREKTIPFRP